MATCVLGLLLNWFAHPFEIIGIESQWQSGLFDTTGPMLVAWTLFALALGTFLGALIGRTVAAMAVTAATVGGLLVVSFVWLVHQLEAFGALATTRIMPMGLNIGQLNQPGSLFNGPVGSWLVRAWFTGPDGKRLSVAAAYNVIGRMYGGPATGKVGPSRWLSVHHYIYWVSYQPGEPLLDLSDLCCGDPDRHCSTSGVRDRSTCPGAAAEFQVSQFAGTALRCSARAGRH